MKNIEKANIDNYQEYTSTMINDLFTVDYPKPVASVLTNSNSNYDFNFEDKESCKILISTSVPTLLEKIKLSFTQSFKHKLPGYVIISVGPSAKNLYPVKRFLISSERSTLELPKAEITKFIQLELFSSDSTSKMSITSIQIFGEDDFLLSSSFSEFPSDIVPESVVFQLYEKLVEYESVKSHLIGDDSDLAELGFSLIFYRQEICFLIRSISPLIQVLLI